jgi:hypothetical protein
VIIAKLIGGLGNQLFQYAAARALALKHGVEVKVDTTVLDKDTKGIYTQRKFELNAFAANIQIANENEIKPFLKRYNKKFIRNLQFLLPNLFSTLYVKENGSRFNAGFLEWPANTYMDGFWQSELYFKFYEEEIRTDLEFNSTIKSKNKLLNEEINSCNSVSLHVRRGDYVSLPTANQFHGLCSLDYYTEAVKIIADKTGDMEIFVFSDDLPWCKQNLKFNFPIRFIDTSDAYSDMYLMTQCKHNIIANSSFSWWGAWLNSNKDKVVVAPKKWFNEPTIDTSDVIPFEWIQI